MTESLHSDGISSQTAPEVNRELQELTDRFRRRVKRTTHRSIILSAILWVAAAAWLTFNVVEGVRLEKQKAALARDVRELRATRDLLLADLGWSPDRLRSMNASRPSIAEALRASEARRQLAAESDPSAREHDTIQIFSRAVDRDVVADALGELGFQVVTREPNPDIPSQTATNAVFFGPNVRLVDVKLVALTLVRAGVPLTTIMPFPDAHGRNHIIQVGSLYPTPRTVPYKVDEIVRADHFANPGVRLSRYGGQGERDASPPRPPDGAVPHP